MLLLLLGQMSLAGTSWISSCAVTNMYDIFSNRVLLSSFDGQPKAMEKVYIVLGVSEKPMTNNSWGCILHLPLGFIFGSLLVLGGVLPGAK